MLIMYKNDFHRFDAVIRGVKIHNALGSASEICVGLYIGQSDRMIKAITFTDVHRFHRPA